MKKRTFTIALLILALTGMLLIESVNGGIVYHPSVPQITINSDGTITPETTQVTRNGAVYTLNGDLNDTQIVIERKNIVFDGANHTITLMNSGQNAAIHISYSTNTTIKNVELVTALYTGILMYECSGCRITGVKSSGHIELGMSSTNVISENLSPIYINYGSEKNQVIRNNITALAISYGQNIIYGNNILLATNQSFFVASKNVWDNGYVGNYWSDYSARYPNASEVDQTGIGDVPYVLDTDNVDRYPTMYPIYIENGTVAVPKPQPTPTPVASTPPTADTTAIYAVGISAILITTVITASLLYRHKQTHKRLTKKTLEATKR